MAKKPRPTKRENSRSPDFISGGISKLFFSFSNRGADGLELSDLEVAISAHTVVESELDAVVRSRTVHDRAKEIFDPGRPLDSFYSQTMVAHAFGIIPTQLRVELDKFGSIRNDFAHKVGPVTFSDPKVEKACLNLDIAKQYIEISRKMGAVTEECLLVGSLVYALFNSCGQLVIGLTDDELYSDKARHRYIGSAKASYLLLYDLADDDESNRS